MLLVVEEPANRSAVSQHVARQRSASAELEQPRVIAGVRHQHDVGIGAVMEHERVVQRVLHEVGLNPAHAQVRSERLQSAVERGVLVQPRDAPERHLTVGARAPLVASRVVGLFDHLPHHVLDSAGGRANDRRGEHERRVVAVFGVSKEMSADG